MPPKKCAHVADDATGPVPKCARTVLDIYVFGTGRSSDLGMGPKAQPGYFEDPTLIEKPCLNKNLSGKAAKTGNIVQVSVGSIHCAVLTKDGTIMTWGVNDTGNLAHNTTWNPDENDEGSDDEELELNPHESTPAQVPSKSFVDSNGKVNKSKFIQVEALDNVTFALVEDGCVWGWGQFWGNDGAFGFLKDQLVLQPNSKPDPLTQTSTSPVLIPSLTNITSLTAGTNHVLALSSTGQVFAWGAGAQGELGRIFCTARTLCNSTPFDCLMPSLVPLPVTAKITKIFAGSHTSFALDTKGKVYAWGLNNWSQMGIPPTAAVRTGTKLVFVRKPTVIKALVGHKIKDIAAGQLHTVVCTDDGTVLAWGCCEDAQMGQDLDGVEGVIVDTKGRPKEVTKPIVVPGVTATTVAAGIDCCIAVTPDGKAYVWGYTQGSCLGFETDDDKVKTPTVLGRDVKDKNITWAGCGAGFSVVAGPAAD